MQDLMTFIANHLALSYALAIVLVLLMIIEILRLKSMTYRIDVTKAVHLINRQNAKVIDIRPSAAFTEQHIIDAQSIPAQELSPPANKLEKLKKHPLILVCSTGLESQKLAAVLQKQGYNVYSLTGGIRAWVAAAMPITKG